MLKKSHLTFCVQAFHSMAIKHVATHAVEVVSKEWKPWPIRQDDHLEAFGNLYKLIAVVRIRNPAVSATHQRASIGQRQLAVFGQRLEDANDLERSFVGFIHHQTSARACCPQQRRILPNYSASLQSWGQCQAGHGCVPMELDILPFAMKQAQQLIGKFVLANALVANEEQMLACSPAYQHALQQPHVCRRLDKFNLGYKFWTDWYALLTSNAPQF
mmetsp:Transcript_6937/g.16070  ORF Transcript_6937/g.16070 Transcript_6937/m.16070 type:complete len:216 (+) Transcript_6937:137-784(+)